MALQAIRILLVGEHLLVRQGLRMVLEKHPDLTVIAETGDPDEAAALVARERPAIAIVDTEAHFDRHRVITELTSAKSAPRVLVLAATADADEHRKAIRSGASGVVLKQQAGEVLVKAIRCVHAGEVWADRTTTALLLQELRNGQARPLDPDSDAARIASLTPRERDIVSRVAQGHGTNRIAREMFISEKTVRNHLASIYAKLLVCDRLELALYAVKHRLGPDDRPVR